MHPEAWSVVDVETTGLHPSIDRIVEIGVVRLDATGREVYAWTSLLDPQRDIGPTRIHGLTARDVQGAPTFRDIADELLYVLSGSVVVAHNARFDTQFLFEECRRAGVAWGPISGLCTMAMSAQLGLCHSRSLADACDELGIPLVNHHTALDDARAAAMLLRLMLPPRFILPALSQWWATPPRVTPVRLRTDPRPPRTGNLTALASRVGAPTEAVDAAPEAVLSYLGLLDLVLEDRVLTDNEVDALRVLATEWGIGAKVAAQLHQHYIHTLWHLALADGVVTHAERNDIEIVAELLGVPLEPAVAESRAFTTPVPPLPAVAAVTDLAGQSVCFTGESVCSVNGFHLERADQERLAAAAGIVVKAGVSGKLDVLVLADPDSMSGKARKARELGVRCMAEPVFWRHLGVEID